MKKRILCLNSEIFSPLYLDLFKNDNGNCFFSNLRFLRFLHNFFLERKREMPSSIFYIVLTSWSNFLWIDDFFSFHNGVKTTCTVWIVTMSHMISRNSSSVCWNKYLVKSSEVIWIKCDFRGNFATLCICSLFSFQLIINRMFS